MIIEEMLAYNKQFVAEKRYEQYAASKYPNKKIAILTCMDTRLVELLPTALDETAYPPNKTEENLPRPAEGDFLPQKPSLPP